MCSVHAIVGRVGLAAVCRPNVIVSPSSASPSRGRTCWTRSFAQGIEVVQLTTEPDVPGSHLYMEAQIFTPDSKRFVLHRSATAHGGSKNDPKHQYLLCDLEDGCALHPLTEELGATGAVGLARRQVPLLLRQRDRGRAAAG